MACFERPCDLPVYEVGWDMELTTSSLTRHVAGVKKKVLEAERMVFTGFFVNGEWRAAVERER